MRLVVLGLRLVYGLRGLVDSDSPARTHARLTLDRPDPCPTLSVMVNVLKAHGSSRPLVAEHGLWLIASMAASNIKYQQLLGGLGVCEGAITSLSLSFLSPPSL